MTQKAPPLLVSKQALTVNGATDHAAEQQQKEAAIAAKNANAPHTRGGRRKSRRRRRGGAQREQVPTLPVASGPPASMPSAQGNIEGSIQTNRVIANNAANDGNVEKPGKNRLLARSRRGGHAHARSQVGQFMDSVNQIASRGGAKRRRRRRTRHKRRRHRRRRTRHKRRRR